MSGDFGWSGEAPTTYTTPLFLQKKESGFEELLEERAPIVIKNEELLEEGAPSFAPARRGRRSSAITPCCPPVAKAGKFITFAGRLCGGTDELVVD